MERVDESSSAMRYERNQQRGVYPLTYDHRSQSSRSPSNTSLLVQHSDTYTDRWCTPKHSLIRESSFCLESRYVSILALYCRVVWQSGSWSGAVIWRGEGEQLLQGSAVLGASTKHDIRTRWDRCKNIFCNQNAIKFTYLHVQNVLFVKICLFCGMGDLFPPAPSPTRPLTMHGASPTLSRLESKWPKIISPER